MTIKKIAGFVRRLFVRLWTFGYPVACTAAPFALAAGVTTIVGVILFFAFSLGRCAEILGPSPGDMPPADLAFSILTSILYAVLFLAITVVLLCVAFIVWAVIIGAVFIPIGWLVSLRNAAADGGIVRVTSSCMTGLLLAVALFAGVGEITYRFAGIDLVIFSMILGALLGVPYFLTLWITGIADTGVRRLYDWLFGAAGVFAPPASIE